VILDRLENAKRYAGVHAGVAKGLEWLATHEVMQLPAGKHPVDGDRMYLNVVRAPGKGQSKAALETHHRYIDIQYSVVGTDLIGWRPAPTCTMNKGYDSNRDLEFHDDAPVAWTAIPAGYFAIYFPEDAHAPMGTDGQVHKVVVKVAV